MSDGKTKTLAAHRKSLLAKDQVKETAREIERLSSDVMGTDHFVYDSNGSNENLAQLFATCDVDRLQALVDGIKRIRQEKETEYFFALKNLTGETE